MSEEPRLITCRRHGERQPTAVVCGHHTYRAGTGLGFVENSTTPGDRQACCDGCEERFLAEGSMTDEFRAFNQMKGVCDGCYDEIKALHAS